MFGSGPLSLPRGRRRSLASGGSEPEPEQEPAAAAPDINGLVQHAVAAALAPMRDDMQSMRRALEALSAGLMDERRNQ